MDPFGLHQEPESNQEPETPATPVSSRKRLWAVLLVLDTVLLFIFGGATAMMYFAGDPVQLWQQLLGNEAPPRPISRPAVAHKGKSPAPVTSAPAPNASSAPAKATPKATPAPSTASNETPLAEPKKAKPVEFICLTKSGTEVSLKGSFLVHSHGGVKKMRKESDGSWHLTVSSFQHSGIRSLEFT